MLGNIKISPKTAVMISFVAMMMSLGCLISTLVVASRITYSKGIFPAAVKPIYSRKSNQKDFFEEAFPHLRAPRDGGPTGEVTRTEFEILQNHLDNSVNTMLAIEVENVALEVKLNITGTGGTVEVIDLTMDNCTVSAGYSICPIPFQWTLVENTDIWDISQPERINLMYNKSYTVGAVCETMDTEVLLLALTYKEGEDFCVDYPSRGVPLSPTGEAYLGNFFYVEKEYNLADNEFLVLCAISNTPIPTFKHCELTVQEFCTVSRCLPSNPEILQTQ